MINGKQASHPLTSASPVRVGVVPCGAHPPHPERLCVSNGFDHYRRQDRSAGYLMLALLVLGGLALLGVVQVIGWLL